eukprot:gnl/MRDRNA2_/MRDRNA2_251043_c0_seq1.p1 gnl/MRDRNA2_/MRDRNA2_251043_c0~~gnl/MRDRNA2_/MRDRNA2_251043_c0_seq1.p1  ORF type:complete len:137 (+),score=24.14 gnl/MRDRNA2_/MRDRNA2_251043_c0_seq1:38-448(+)
MKAKELVKTWFHNIDQQNFEAVKNLMAADHIFHNPMTPAPIGANEHIGMMQHMTAAWDGEHHLDLVLEDGDHVVARGRWSGKHVGEFNGVPATGKHVEFSWIDIFEVADGKVTREYFEMNPMSIMAQIAPAEQQEA